mmetsp:Transcript_85388/g.227680  ORF Transcript_85388/g.227680 Transcript_85388/m.227680 type:complete len:229 (+) Transcript_85388:1-687(+)
MTSVFSSVPRPNAANNVSSQVSSFLDTVKASGTSAINLVKDNSQLQAGAAAIKNKASQLSDNVSNVLKSTPIAAVSQQASEKAQQVQGLITGQTKEPETVAEYVEEAMTMSYKNRLIGFGICLASGIFFTALSMLMLPFIVLKPHKFALSYSIGNLLMMSSTLFLVGPKRQFQNMFSGERAMASGAYFGSMIGTIYAALGLRIYILVLLFIGQPTFRRTWAMTNFARQ